ncbi:MAG: ATP-binding protein [bacterium]|nr:ATP-binding protein [bacterium]MDD5354704.1 ATP-binding protein [bacterium]MDD5756852.1 ATP-binding protein [bacterium]
MIPVPNPFTPKTGWEPKIIVGRDSDLEFFSRKLYEARRGRCDHFIVTGGWGMGKTSLLLKYKKIAEAHHVFTSFVSINEFNRKNTDLDGVKYLIEQIPRRFPLPLLQLKNFMKEMKALDVEVIGRGLNFSSKVEGIHPQTLLTDVLLALWQDIQEHSEAGVILLDDVQNFQPINSLFTILKNVLTDEQIINRTKFLFILSSVPTGWEKFLAKHHPIGRYFSPRIQLQKLNKADMKKVILANLEDTGVEFEEEVIKRVIHHSEGNPYQLQQACASLYDKQIGGKVSLIKKNEIEDEIF